MGDPSTEFVVGGCLEVNLFNRSHLQHRSYVSGYMAPAPAHDSSHGFFLYGSDLGEFDVWRQLHCSTASWCFLRRSHGTNLREVLRSAHRNPDVASAIHLRSWRFDSGHRHHHRDRWHHLRRGTHPSRDIVPDHHVFGHIGYWVGPVIVGGLSQRRELAMSV